MATARRERGRPLMAFVDVAGIIDAEAGEPSATLMLRSTPDQQAGGHAVAVTSGASGGATSAVTKSQRDSRTRPTVARILSVLSRSDFVVCHMVVSKGPGSIVYDISLASNAIGAPTVSLLESWVQDAYPGATIVSSSAGGTAQFVVTGRGSF